MWKIIVISIIDVSERQREFSSQCMFNLHKVLKLLSPCHCLSLLIYPQCRCPKPLSLYSLNLLKIFSKSSLCCWLMSFLLFPLRSYSSLSCHYLSALSCVSPLRGLSGQVHRMHNDEDKSFQRPKHSLLFFLKSELIPDASDFSWFKSKVQTQET